MADNEKPVIRVIGFKQTYEKHPVRGTDPLNDNVDAHGFILNAAGKRIMEVKEEDWVVYAPAHSPLATQNVERVRHMIPDPERVGEDHDGSKLAFMTARWSQIEPAYSAWKKGQELPIHGTALSVWPAINSEQVKVFRQVGILSVEEVRDLSETQISRVPLPNMRELKKQASIFLDNMGGAAAAEREALKDEKISTLEDRLAELEKLLDTRTTPAPQPADVPDDEVAALRAELDAKDIEYDKRWAAPKLRAALANEAA
ncbi:MULTISPECIES: hypothetical protein [unclassified Mesorhizobium]|uniref:hypothetical protein n=1 Tax=unclassified Mesorhizobium TaxID=325217 RepID=UPI00301577EC